MPSGSMKPIYIVSHLRPLNGRCRSATGEWCICVWQEADAGLFQQAKLVVHISVPSRPSPRADEPSAGSGFGVGVPSSCRRRGLRPAVAATRRLERHHRAVSRGEDSAPTAAFLPQLLQEERRSGSPKNSSNRDATASPLPAASFGVYFARTGTDGKSSRAVRSVRVGFMIDKNLLF